MATTPMLPNNPIEWNHGGQQLPQVAKQARIAVLCGGISSEREVSLRSGANCLAALHRLGYSNAVSIDVGRDIAHQLTQAQIEVAFLALHGELGEDGAIQGVLEYLAIPYTGNRIAASAVTMDKALTKKVLGEAGLPVLHTLQVQWPLASVEQTQALLARVADEVGYPLMVKPLGLGSSVGMSKVNDPNQLPMALDIAAVHQQPIMLEPFVKGRDLTIGVVHVDGQPTVTPILELRSHREWYDYEAKYTPGQTDFLLPAPLSATLTQAVQATALAAHKALNCHGVSRTDVVMDQATEAFYILEVNSIPGMTDLSDLPAQCSEMCMSYDQLVFHLLQTAVQTPQWVASLANPEEVEKAPDFLPKAQSVLV
jgi:D-alanine-D-alanine ligase